MSKLLYSARHCSHKIKIKMYICIDKIGSGWATAVVGAALIFLKIQLRISWKKLLGINDKYKWLKTRMRLSKAVLNHTWQSKKMSVLAILFIYYNMWITKLLVCHNKRNLIGSRDSLSSIFSRTSFKQN